MVLLAYRSVWKFDCQSAIDRIAAQCEYLSRAGEVHDLNVALPRCNATIRDYALSRFYSLIVTPPLGSSPQWTSYPNGKNDPGALNVELDLLSSFYGIPDGDVGNSTITIHGVPLSDLQQAQNFYGSNIAVLGGMKKGLPLAVPAQSGVLLQGQIFQSFANWQRTEMNLSFVVVPSGNTISSPGNFVFNWQKGQSLAAALSATLSVVYPKPKYKILMQIGSGYSTATQKPHYVPTLTEFSKYILQLTETQSTEGVNIALWNNNTVLVTDGTVKQAKPTQLLFTDLIGQPKWVAPNTMQFSTVMRADINVGAMVLMPKNLPNAPGSVTTTAAAAPSQLKYKVSFQGQFIVQSVRHIGNFRDPDGTAWSTIFEAFPLSV